MVDNFLAIPGDLSLFGNLSLDIDWQQDSEIDQDGFFGRNVLKTLFCYLGKQTFKAWPRRPSIAAFGRISISVPTMVKTLAPNDIPKFLATECDSIQLQGAIHLKKFYWKGHFTFLANKIKGILFLTLGILDISGCTISITNALLFLHLCPNLTVVALETIAQAKGCDHWSDCPLEPCEFPRVVLPLLQEMKITSDAPLLPLFERIQIGPSLHAIYLVLGSEGVQDLSASLQALCCLTHVKTFRVQVRGDPDPWEVASLLRMFPSIRILNSLHTWIE